jgi:hypothetical protein
MEEKSIYSDDEIEREEAEKNQARRECRRGRKGQRKRERGGCGGGCDGRLEKGEDGNKTD